MSTADDAQSEPRGSAKERFSQVAEAFDRLRELPAPERDSALRKLQPQIADEVRRLLALHETSDGLLDDPASAVDQDLLREVIAEHDGVPKRIGAYRPLQVLGSGGMGTVYLADRPDADFEQRVAVKVLRAEGSDRDLMLRFRTERRILAALKHPNIAGLLDGGTTAEGRPFVVMEYVAGEDIVSHCRAHDLGLHQRLSIFRTVCHAVDHAHRRLVVHRDLKPDNIMVTDEGSPKLLDFGIAKLLESDETDVSMAQTRTGMRLLTPEYASPEQVRGETVTTATDVYALGAILFELLTGERAQPLQTRRAAEMERVICESPPPVPSTTSEGRLRKVDNDLDVIVQKAMHKDVTRRYRSVLELESDVARHLDGRPLLAKPDTWRYRTRRFVGRNRYKVATAAVFALTLVGFAITMAVQANRIAKERDAATSQAAIRGEISDFLVDLFEIADPGETRADLVRARDLLDKGSNRIVNELKSGPVVRAGLMEAMGRAYVALGLYVDAEPLLLEALNIRESQGDPQALGRSLLAIAELRLGEAELETASSVLDQATQALAQRSDPAPAELDVTYHQVCARLAWEVGDPNAAVDHANQAHGILVALHGPRHVSVANALIDLGSMRVERGDFDGAERDIEAGRALRRELFGSNQADRATDLRILGNFRNAAGQPELALKAFRAALAIDERLLGPGHPDRSADMWGIATALNGLGKPAEGTKVLEELIDLEREQLGEHPQVALSMRELAGILGTQGNFKRSEELFSAALKIEQARLPADHPQTATTMANFGSMLHRHRRLDEALPLITAAMEMRKRLYPPDHPTVLSSYVQSALIHYYAKDYGKAEAIYREALAVRREKLGVHPETAGTMYGVSIALHAQGKNEEAIPLLEESLEILSATVAPEHVHNARSLGLLAKIHLQAGRLDDAETAYLRCMEIHRTGHLPSHPVRVNTVRRFAECLRLQQRVDEARELLEQELNAIDEDQSMATRAMNSHRASLEALQSGPK